MSLKNISVFRKKGSIFVTQKVSVLPEIGVGFFFKEKGGGGCILTRRTLIRPPFFRGVGVPGIHPYHFRWEFLPKLVL